MRLEPGVSSARPGAAQSARKINEACSAHTVTTMPEEREIKIPVGTDFVLPDLDGVVEGTRAVERGTVKLSATYWDTDDLVLLRAKLGLRTAALPAAGQVDAQSG